MEQCEWNELVRAKYRRMDRGRRWVREVAVWLGWCLFLWVCFEIALANS